MKKLLFILLIIFSSQSFAEWTKLVTVKSGLVYYVDFDRVRMIDGFIYYWGLYNYPNPDENGDL